MITNLTATPTLIQQITGMHQPF